MVEITRSPMEGQHAHAWMKVRAADEVFSALQILHIAETSLPSFR